MKHLLLIAILSIFVVGCSSTKDVKYITRVETVTVFKPVHTPPKQLQDLPEIVRPDLATNRLSKQDKENPGYVVKIVIESIAQLRSYAETLEARIAIYEDVLSKPADTVPDPITTVEVTESDAPKP